MEIRKLFLKKESLRKKLEDLWALRDKRDWSEAERLDYDKHKTEADKVNSDLKLRAEFIEQFKLERSKEDVDFAKSERQASLFNIIRAKIYEQTRDSAYKDDYGRVNEVLTEHKHKTRARHVKDGFTPIPESAFQVAKTRTDITSATGSGEDLISQTVMPSMYVEGLYEDTWMTRVGVPVLSGLEGDLKIPRINTKPGFSWIAENANFPEQAMDFDDVTLQPKYAGAIQIFSLGIFLRAAGSSVVRFIQQELMRSFRSGLDKSFIQDDGTNNKPKGLYSIVQSTNEVVANENGDANTGGDLTYAKCLETEAKITSTNQTMPLTWLINDKVRLKGLQKLKFTVSGSSQLYMPGSNMLADRPTVLTNSIQDNIKKGTGDTSKIVLFQPQSLVLGRWIGGIQLQVNTQGAEYWKAGKTAVRVIDVCNLVSRRDSDFAVLKEINA